MPGTAPRRPTLNSVAAAASVSRQTVSNVLNAPHLVARDTRERVEAVIARTGYRPMKAAQMMRTRRSQLIAVGIPTPADGRGALLDSFLHALSRSAQQRGYRMLLLTGADDAEEIGIYRQLLDEYDLDAFVLTGTHTDDSRIGWLQDRGTPFVTFGRPWGRPARHFWVDVDGAHGVRAATEHLAAAGHRRIAFLGWPTGSGVGEDRRAGWAEACRTAGLPMRGLARRMEDDLVAGRTACLSMLDSAEPPTAFVCVSDTIALGAWAALTSRGLVPGRDAAIVGFDDSPAAAVTGLSSVAQPVDDVAASCLDGLQHLLDQTRSAGRRRVPKGVLLAPRLVLRASTGADS